jgi:diamine N-acetyltransferase
MIAIRAAQPYDAALVFALVRELADYEELLHAVDATEAMISEALFGDHPRAFCEIVSWNGEAAGLALWFYSFSTFRGRHGLYLEDLFVRPAFRGKGFGKALLVHLAQRCVSEGLARFEWSVLDWNEPSIAFYKAMGAEMMDGWTGCRVSGAALVTLAGVE